MLPVLEHAQQMSATLQKLESENQLFKTALEQHEAEALKRGTECVFIISRTLFRHIDSTCDNSIQETKENNK